MGFNANDKCLNHGGRARKASRPRELANVGDYDLIRLTEAPQLPELRGLLTVSALRREKKNGRLAVIEIANKHYVTRAAIKEMIEKCRANNSPSISGPGQLVTTGAENSRTMPFGSSGREADRCEARAAASKIARELSARSKTISRKGEGQK